MPEKPDSTLCPLPVKSLTKKGYQIAFPGDSIDLAFVEQNTRRGRVGHNIAHTITTSPSQSVYFIDMNNDPKLTKIARCITARQDSGVSKHKAEHSAVLVLIKEIQPNEIILMQNDMKFENTTDKPVPILIITNSEGKSYLGFIKKLEPRECWRLQGFTDEQFDKVVAAGIKNGQLYKQAGNAVTVSVIAAIGRFIKGIFNEVYN